MATLPAKIMGLEGYGLVVGCYGDLVILQASYAIEAIRLKATRLAVIGRKPVIATTTRTAHKREPGGMHDISASFGRPQY
jgi:cytosine/adenosine deaminase-related metal-dependent hydrolase